MKMGGMASQVYQYNGITSTGELSDGQLEAKKDGKDHIKG